MRALHFDGAELRCIDDHPEPSPGEDEAVVRVHLAGVCSTDLQILAGYMGFTGVPGHEFVGEVVDGPTDIAEQRVVGEINYACRRCPTCRRGLGRHCPRRRVMGILGADGAFAEYLAVPLTNLHVVPDAVPDEAAVFTEPLAAAFSILEQVTLGPGDGVVVLGDGKLGLLCAQVLAGTGASVTLVGKHAENLALVADRGGWRPPCSRRGPPPRLPTALSRRPARLPVSPWGRRPYAPEARSSSRARSPTSTAYRWRRW